MLRHASLILAAALIIAWAAPAHSTQVINRIVAVVNGEIITLSELDANARPTLARLEAQGYSVIEQEQALPEIRRQVLEKMINDILLVHEAETLGIEVSEVEVENYINQFKQEHGLNEDMLLAQLQFEGMTREEYGTNVRNTLLRTRLLQFMVRRKVLVTNEDVEEYFQEHMDEYASDMSLNVSVLIVQDQDLVRELHDDIAAGDLDFAEAAREHSVGPEADNGGNLGDFRYRDLSEEWREALAGLNQGDVSDPLVVEGRYALLYVNSVDIQGDVSLEDVQEEIYDTLEQQKLDSLLAEYIGQLRDKAIIDVRL